MGVSTTLEPLTLKQATSIADQLIEQLKPYCVRGPEKAGSLRRRRPHVNDIELVCIPKVETVRDLLGSEVNTRNLFFEHVSKLKTQDQFQPRLSSDGKQAWGDRFQRAWYKGVALDLFSVLPPAQWGVIFLIRTGSSEFSHRFVTPKHMGGDLPVGMQIRDGALWNRGVIVPTPEESDVFKAVGREFVKPEFRA